MEIQSGLDVLLQKTALSSRAGTSAQHDDAFLQLMLGLPMQRDSAVMQPAAIGTVALGEVLSANLVQTSWTTPGEAELDVHAQALQCVQQSGDAEMGARSQQSAQEARVPLPNAAGLNEKRFVSQVLSAELHDQHWFAVGKLSYLGATSQQTGAALVQSAEAFSLFTSRQAVHPAQRAEPASPSAVLGSPAHPWVESLSRVGTNDLAASRAGSAPALLPEHLVQALRRKITVVEAEETVQVWVRDFDLDPESATALVEQLLNFQKQDARVRHYYLNGHLVQTTTTHSHSKGDDHAG